MIFGPYSYLAKTIYLGYQNENDLLIPNQSGGHRQNEQEGDTSSEDDWSDDENPKPAGYYLI